MDIDPWKDEEKLINGTSYRKCVHPTYLSHWEPNGVGNWKNIPFLCGQCESKAMEVLSTDSYETSAKCIACGFQAVVHSG